MTLATPRTSSHDSVQTSRARHTMEEAKRFRDMASGSSSTEGSPAPEDTSIHDGPATDPQAKEPERSSPPAANKLSNEMLMSDGKSLTWAGRQYVRGQSNKGLSAEHIASRRDIPHEAVERAIEVNKTADLLAESLPDDPLKVPDIAQRSINTLKLEQDMKAAEAAAAVARDFLSQSKEKQGKRAIDRFRILNHLNLSPSSGSSATERERNIKAGLSRSKLHFDTTGKDGDKISIIKNFFEKADENFPPIRAYFDRATQGGKSKIRVVSRTERLSARLEKISGYAWWDNGDKSISINFDHAKHKKAELYIQSTLFELTNAANQAVFDEIDTNRQNGFYERLALNLSVNGKGPSASQLYSMDVEFVEYYGMHTLYNILTDMKQSAYNMPNNIDLSLMIKSLEYFKDIHGPNGFDRYMAAPTTALHSAEYIERYDVQVDGYPEIGASQRAGERKDGGSLLEAISLMKEGMSLGRAARRARIVDEKGFIHSLDFQILSAYENRLEDERGDAS